MTRPFTVHDVDQRSSEWHQLRAGLLTASVAGEMMARIKSGEAAARRDLRTRLVCERLTGRPQEDTYVSRDTQRGIDEEPMGLAQYELSSSVLVRPVGFVKHDSLPCGYSPDGVIGDFDGLLELKCPRPSNHLKYLRVGALPSEYQWQVIHALWLTGAAWCDFASYCEQFPESLRLFVTRVHARDVDLAAYELNVRTFLGEVDKEVAEVLAMGGVAA